jgi:hypothetical protein
MTPAVQVQGVEVGIKGETFKRTKDAGILLKHGQQDDPTKQAHVYQL